MRLDVRDPRATALTDAVKEGDVEGLQRMLDEEPSLARAVVVNERGEGRSLLHLATDWPGGFPNVAQTIALLAAAGADVNAKLESGPHQETPLHWAASSDDVEAVAALLEAGADIEAPGAVFTGGSPMSDAVIFEKWRAARVLLERGATTTLPQAAALGLIDRVKACFLAPRKPTAEETTGAFWHACRAGHLETAKLLYAQGADCNWVGWNKTTPFEVARKSGNRALVEWLETQRPIRNPPSAP